MNPQIKRLKKVFGVVYFVQGMSSLPQLSFFYYMMNVLKLGPVAGQLFQGLDHVAWFLKPLWGWTSDRFPLRGYRRKSYFCLMATLAVFSWFSIALCAYFKITAMIPYFLFLNLAQLAYAFVDVVVDALMVERGQELNQVGHFVNFQWMMLGLAAMLVALFSGWFQTKIEGGKFSYALIFALTGLFPLLTLIIGVKNLEEEKGIYPQVSPVSFWKKFRNPFKSFPEAKIRFRNFEKEYRAVLLLALFTVAWNFSPSVSYAARAYWVSHLEFTPLILGILGAASNVVLLLSILVYRWVVRRFALIQWYHYLYAMVALGVVSLAAGYYLYLPPGHPLSFSFSFPWERILSLAAGLKESVMGSWIYRLLEGASHWNRYHWWALFTETTLGFASIAAFMIPLTLAGEVAQRHHAGFTYALLMSVSNFTNAIGNVAGGVLYKLFSLSAMTGFMKGFETSLFNLSHSHDSEVLILQLFVYISAFFTLLAIPFVGMVRRELERKGIKVKLG
ncbi:MAG: hypothetical protein HYS08_09250 [Chlamydiae bacterium]|nr:hypothetical protein [Chlamydiota bacterium]MBI3267324.1 hypothetical protein [Chlamydiota bacterium]